MAGFGGQSLIVMLRGEREVRVGDHRTDPHPDAAGGPPLNDVLGRALDDSFVFLRGIDPYGDTVFNRLQMQWVLPELERLTGAARTDLERRTVDRVIDLARLCANSVHTYLVFVGD